MARSRYEEALRLYVETAGDEELKALISQLGEIGDVAEAEGAAARKAFEGLNDAAEKLAKVDAFAKLKRDLVATESELQQAQAGAQALFREFDGRDTSNSSVVRLQREARKAVSELAGEADRQRLALQRARSELQAMGVDTRNLGTAQGALRGRFAEARATLSGAIGDLQRYRAESARTAGQVARDNRDTADSYGIIGRSVRGLRGLLAGVGAYLGFREAASGVVNLLRVAAASEDARRSLQNLYGGQEAGNRAFEQLQQLASRNGLAFQAVVDQARKLKAFGLDPLNGSLQALINQNAAVGGSQQDLEGKVLALGQAWAKQKLQGEEILQLVERGVPVWELLSKVTGKNVTELQKLSERGALGRDVIRGLYEEIGRANAGAAQSGLSSLSGLLGQVTARWNQFLIQVANAGVSDYFKRQVSELLGGTRDLDAVAKQVATGIVRTFEALKRLALQFAPVIRGVFDFTAALAKNAEAVLFAAKVYAALKIARLATEFTAAARAAVAMTAATEAAGIAADAAGGRVGRLSGLLRALPAVARVSLYVLGAEVAWSQIQKIQAALDNYQRAALDAERTAINLGGIQQELARTGQQLTSVYRDYADVAIRGATEIGRLTREEADQYAFALGQAQNYYRGLAVAAKAAGDAQAEAVAVDRFRALGVAIGQVQERLDAIAASASKQQGFRAFVDKAVADFDRLASKGETTRKAISGIFDGLDLSSARGAEQAVSILDQISIRGTRAAESVREELRKALSEVADGDLPRLKEAAAAAMGSGSAGATAFAEAVNTINLARLGVDLEEVRTGLGAGARTAIEQFRAATREVKTLGLTADQQSKAIAKAFRGAFQQVSTAPELQEIEKSLREAASAGVINTAEYNAAVGDVRRKLDELKQSGMAAGQGVAAGANEAAASLDVVGQAAQKAAADVESVGDAGGAAAEGVREADSAARSFTVSLSGVSDEFVRLLRTKDAFQLGEAFRAQEAELREQVQRVEDLNSEFDTLSKRRKELRQKFNLVSPDTVDQLLQAEEKLEQNRKRRDEAERKSAEDARQKAAEALAEAREIEAARAREGLETVQIVRLEVVAGDGVQQVLSTGGRISPATAQQLAQALGPPLLTLINRSRSGSNRRNTRR